MDIVTPEYELFEESWKSLEEAHEKYMKLYTDFLKASGGDIPKQAEESAPAREPLTPHECNFHCGRADKSMCS